MASSSNHQITFLVRTSDKQSDFEKKHEILSRHRHAALVTHQRNKQKRLPVRPSEVIVSHPGSRQRPPPAVASQNWRTRSRITNISTAEPALSPRSEPSIGLFDPFDIFVVDNLSRQAQDVFRSGKCSIPRIDIQRLIVQPSSTNGLRSPCQVGNKMSICGGQ